MSFDDIRPVISGILGAICAVALGRALSRWLPQAVNGKSAETLLRENRVPIRVANALLIGGFVIVVVMYRLLGFPDNDLTPIGVGFGFGLSTPMIGVQLAAFAMGQNPREALMAYALKQRMPLVALYSISAVAFFLFIAAIVSLIR